MSTRIVRSIFRHSARIALPLATVAVLGAGAACSETKNLPSANGYVTATTTGVHLGIQSARITHGVARVQFTITDDNGAPLDSNGVLTEGAVSTNWTIARLGADSDGTPGQYTSYVVKTVTPDGGPQATQGSTEHDGNFSALRAGTYQYTFKAPVVPPDSTQTHTVGVYATRVFQGQTYVADATYDFRPDGKPVQLQRQEVTEATCNQCHHPLALHGGARRETALCILCHNPQSTDPYSGNTLDFKVLIHKLHRGAGLPSVGIGKPYQIIGYRQSVDDFSTVVFPQDVGHCETCHTNKAAAGSTGSPTNAFEPDVWKTKIGTTACFSCHDNMEATPMQGSSNLHIVRRWPTNLGQPIQSSGPNSGRSFACSQDSDCESLDGLQSEASCDTSDGGTAGDCLLTDDDAPHPTDNIGEATCTLCHAVGATLAPVDRVHRDLKYDPAQHTLAINIMSVTSTAPTEVPVMTFDVTDQATHQPYDILQSPLPALTVNVNGPTTDYDLPPTTLKVQSAAGGTVGTLVADPAGKPGQFVYTFPPTNPIAADATGTFAFGMEGYTLASDSRTRLPIRNTVFYAAVTDPAAVPRPAIVDTAKCESCHKTIGSNHGFTRNDVSYCVLCHNATFDDRGSAKKMSEAQMVNGQAVAGVFTANPVHFDVLIHKLHRGAHLTQPFTLGVGPDYGFDANTILFPGDLRDCKTCHIQEPDLPLAGTRLPTRSEQFTCQDPNPQMGKLCSQWWSGGGPSGAGTNIPDGTVLWNEGSAGGPATPWMPNTTYALGASVTANGDVYTCAQTGVSGSGAAQVTETPPVTAACTGCHDRPDEVAHAAVMTDALGVESCGTCHADGSAFGIDVVHAVPP